MSVTFVLKIFKKFPKLQAGPGCSSDRFWSQEFDRNSWRSGTDLQQRWFCPRLRRWSQPVRQWSVRLVGAQPCRPDGFQASQGGLGRREYGAQPGPPHRPVREEQPEQRQLTG